MTVHAKYFVRCVGGGYLDPGRPLICLGVSQYFPSATGARRAADAAGWSHDPGTGEHRCPEHQTGDGHVHYFRRNKEDYGKINAAGTCVCGAIRSAEGEVTWTSN